MRSPTLVITASLVWVACSAGSRHSIANADAGESSGSANSRVKTVLIKQFKFQPDTLTVHVGDSVEWKNDDIVPHTATSLDEKTFDSGRIARSASWRFTVTKNGMYDYQCTFHPNMKGKLVVQ
jgi:plastocyanin